MTFSDRVFASVLNRWGAAVAVIGLIGTLAPIYIDLTGTVGIKYVLAIVIFGFVVLIFLLRLAFEAHNDSMLKSPKVLGIQDPPSTYKEYGEALLVLEPSDLISHDSLVSVYYIDQNQQSLELFVGLGRVLIVQNDKRIQILVLNTEESDKSITEIKSNAQNDLKFVFVKPSVPHRFLQ
ncbi:TPA: hypothetical protein ACX6RJ_002082 [Photobacterium damselae]